jgi:dUTP pyrophosphatase
MTQENIYISGRKIVRAHKSDAGLDLIADRAFIIPANSSKLVKTGTKIAIPFGFCGQVWPRSGLSVKYGIETGAGLIDSGFRGEMQVHLYNNSPMDFKALCGDRIAQLVIVPIWTGEVVLVDDVAVLESDRGEGGFGSTGIA